MRPRKIRHFGFIFFQEKPKQWLCGARRGILNLLFVLRNVSLDINFSVNRPPHIQYIIPKRTFQDLHILNTLIMTEETKKDEPESPVSSTAGAAAEASDQPAPAEGAAAFREPRRRKLPSVKYLLEHGDPETAHLPKSRCETIGFPLTLGLVFALSLLVFLHAPHHLAPAREPYVIPGYRRPAIFDAALSKTIPLEHKKRILEQKRKQNEEL
jgi:hypothetical protein